MSKSGDRTTEKTTDRPALEAAAVEAAMRLAAADGWGRVTLTAVAEEAGIGRDALRAIADDKSDLLRLFIRRIDTEVLAEEDGFTEVDSVRDRLFDLLMRRFDALTPYKDGVASAVSAVMRDPLASLTLAPVGVRALGWYLDAAGVPTDGPLGALRLKGLTLVWLSALRTWIADDTPDLARTMKTLDKALARAERAAGWLEGRRPAPSDAAPESDPAEPGGPERGSPGDDLA